MDGVEYFRSECYYLKFAWLLPGQAAAFLPGVRWECIGVYGLGFLYVSAAAMIVGRSKRVRLIGAGAAALFAILMYVPALAPAEEKGELHVAGVQLEQPDDQQAADALDRLAIAHPEAQILVLSEYSFAGGVPEVVRDVVRKHQRYLIAGGIKLLSQGQFYDTAFVIGPDGQDVFEQVKSVPVQFMGDGLPAPQRRVWESPWGKIGVAICYDVSYARVMDDFVRQGAEGLILPTMDVVTWGEYERRMLHGRLAPVRAAEYGIPVFSVWSSGESQLVDRRGRVIATAGYPGQGEMIAGPFDLRGAGRVPPDRVVAMGAVIGTGILIVYLVYIGWISERLGQLAVLDDDLASRRAGRGEMGLGGGRRGRGGGFAGVARWATLKSAIDFSAMGDDADINRFVLIVDEIEPCDNLRCESAPECWGSCQLYTSRGSRIGSQQSRVLQDAGLQ